MKSIKIWLQAVRVPFSTATVIPIVLGSAMAWHDGAAFMWGRFWLALAGGLLIHFGTNMANDYWDHVSGCDPSNKNFNQFSGGSRVIQEGKVTPAQEFWASVAVFAAGSAIGLYLNHVSSGNFILWVGFIGVFLGVFYSAKPISIGYGSLGELATGAGFGPLMVMGSYYVQAQKMHAGVFLNSIPVGILIALVLYINEFPDHEADKLANKKTLVVVLGKKRAVILYHVMLAATFLFSLFLIAYHYAPKSSALILLSLPLAFKAYKVSGDNYEKFHELLPANAFTIALHASLGILFTAGFILDKIL